MIDWCMKMWRALFVVLLCAGFAGSASGSLIVEGVVTDDYWPLRPVFVDVGDSMRLTIFDYDTPAEVQALPIGFEFLARLQLGSLDEVRIWENPGGPPAAFQRSGSTHVPLSVGGIFDYNIDIGSVIGPITRVVEHAVIPEPTSAWLGLGLAVCVAGKRRRA